MKKAVRKKERNARKKKFSRKKTIRKICAERKRKKQILLPGIL